MAVQTSWLDADAYASVIVTVEKDDEPRVIPLGLDRNRALQLLARASRDRRRRSPTAVRGQLALLRVA